MFRSNQRSWVIVLAIFGVGCVTSLAAGLAWSAGMLPGQHPSAAEAAGPGHSANTGTPGTTGATVSSKGPQGQPGSRESMHAELAAGLKQAVADGKISAEDARAKFAVMRKKIGADRSSQCAKTFSREDYANASAKLDQAVADGKISAEDARAKLAVMRKMIGAGSARRGVGGLIETLDGDTITIKTSNALIKVQLSDQTTILKFAQGSRQPIPASRMELKAGAGIRVGGTKGDDGTIRAEFLHFRAP